MSYTAPPWPPHFQTGRLVGQFIDITGQPSVGTVTLTPKPTSLIVPNDAATISITPIILVLDSNGAIAADIPSTNDPDVRPIKWTYHVKESFGSQREYDIHVPMGVTTNILDVAPVQPSIGLMRYIGAPGPPGPPGSPGLPGSSATAGYDGGQIATDGSITYADPVLATYDGGQLS